MEYKKLGEVGRNFVQKLIKPNKESFSLLDVVHSGQDRKDEIAKHGVLDDEKTTRLCVGVLRKRERENMKKRVS